MESVDSLLDDVDAGFDNILGGDEEGPRTQRESPAEAKPAERPSGGLSGARELFSQLAAGHVRHVRDFMIDVKAAQARTEWVAVCEPAIRSIRQMGEQLAMPELCAALDAFSKALAKAGEERAPQVSDSAREALLDAYRPLIAAMPAAFALDEARSAREGVIVQSLLLQIPEVRKVALDKLYAAGLTSLDVYVMAKPAEISETTGLPIEVAKKISDKFRNYKKELESAKVDADRSFEHGRLAELAKALEKHQAAFEAAEQDGDSKKKREERKAREEVLLEVKVLLARLGETDRLANMDKLPFAQKVAELEAYLEEATQRAKRGPK